MKIQTAHLVFPHQLFEDTSRFKDSDGVYLVEEYLFFKQYKFHKQKIVFHRASMKAYESLLRKKNIQTQYIDSEDALSDIRLLIPHLKQIGVKRIAYTDVSDQWLQQRITTSAALAGISVSCIENPHFLNSVAEINEYFDGRKRYFQTDFYIHQRKKFKLLLTPKGEPAEGKWSFDAENRLKYPAKKIAPKVTFPKEDVFQKEAKEYVRQKFNGNYGELPEKATYPHTNAEAKAWLYEFLNERFEEFGSYEDAIVSKEVVLHHSVLTPILNTGLLLPGEVIDEALSVAAAKNIPINSLEGFIRQIIGWREFIRAMYLREGVRQRTTNYWKFSRKIPESFYTGTTGIVPVDTTIRKLLKHGYSHHIERLMILGNFMLLCEFDPDEVYRWFMEMYIDAYDWVMVPNVYGMSQFADGGLMCTKPYISGSNYVLKMSDYPKGEWTAIWDALFWRFMHVHRDFFLQNPRLGMLIRTFDKMDTGKQQQHLTIAEDYLKSLD
jgi:deoxyribodipyrimidine photolyase-related protein